MRVPRFVLLLLVVLLVPATAWAFESLFKRVPLDRELAALFRDGETVAEVQGGVLIGQGRERWQRLPTGGLRIIRTWTYPQVRHPDHGTVHKLPQPWVINSTLEVTKTLRLLRADTQLHFHRSADRVLDDYVISEERPKLFEWDRASTVADSSGKRLTRTTYLGKEVVEQDTYDYDADAIPFEIASFYLSVALEHWVDRFNFDLLLPGGSEHGVHAEVHHTRDPKPYARKYRLPKHYLEPKIDLAIVDLRLSSTIKRVFFPHHIYMAFAHENPTQIEMIWGGDPDEPLQAFRVP
jgi:hypothetical protein